MDFRTTAKEVQAATEKVANPREEPEDGGHRASMYGMGFSHDCVGLKAIQELGEGVDRDMLMEYLLFISDQRERDERGPPRNGEISTLQKLRTEFQFLSAAVEKAMNMNTCNTPLQIATQEDIAIVVDFLAAHVEALIEVPSKSVGLMHYGLWICPRDRRHAEKYMVSTNSGSMSNR